MHLHSLVPQLSMPELFHPSLVSYQRFTCCFALLTQCKRFWEGSRQFISPFCQCRPWTLLLQGWRLFHEYSCQGFAASKWNTTGEEFGKDWPLTSGSGATRATRTSTKMVILSPGTQTNHLFKNRAPSSDHFMVHTPDPAHTITPSSTLPFCCGLQAGQRVSELCVEAR